MRISDWSSDVCSSDLNLPHNGARLEAAVLTMARAHDAGLADWIAAEGAFPQTMVDRIVPATTPEDVTTLGQRLGVEDRAMVKTRSEEHTSELQSLMRISYAVF